MWFYLPDNDAKEFIDMAYRVCIWSPVSNSCRHSARNRQESRERALATSFEQSIGNACLNVDWRFFFSRLTLFAAILFSLSSPSSSLPSVTCEDLGTSSVVACYFSFTKSDQTIFLFRRDLWLKSLSLALKLLVGLLQKLFARSFKVSSSDAIDHWNVFTYSFVGLAREPKQVLFFFSNH